MSKPFRDVQHAAVFCRQFCRFPLLERGRIESQVNDYIVNRSHRASHQLGFFVELDLIVHPAQSAFSLVERKIALHEPGVKPTCFKFALAPTSSKEAAFIFDPLWVDDERTLQRRRCEYH